MLRLTERIDMVGNSDGTIEDQVGVWWEMVLS